MELEFIVKYAPETLRNLCITSLVQEQHGRALFPRSKLSKCTHEHYHSHVDALLGGVHIRFCSTEQVTVVAHTMRPGVAAELVHTVRITVHPQLRKIMQYDCETTVCRGVARFQQGGFYRDCDLARRENVLFE